MNTELDERARAAAEKIEVVKAEAQPNIHDDELPATPCQGLSIGEM
jgi:hypothetical protein